MSSDKPRPIAIASDQKELNATCALCKKKALRAFRPFCSKRCKDVDLGNWFTGKYAIPGDAEDEKTEFED